MTTMKAVRIHAYGEPDVLATRFEDPVHDVNVVFDTMGGDVQERS